MEFLEAVGAPPSSFPIRRSSCQHRPYCYHTNNDRSLLGVGTFVRFEVNCEVTSYASAQSRKF